MSAPDHPMSSSYVTTGAGPEDIAWEETEEAAECRTAMAVGNDLMARMARQARSPGVARMLADGIFVGEHRAYLIAADPSLPDSDALPSAAMLNGAVADTSQPYPWDAIKAENEARAAFLVDRITDLIGE